MKRSILGLAALLAAGLLGNVTLSASAQTAGGDPSGAKGTAGNGAQATTARAASGMLSTAEFNFTQTVANMNQTEFQAAKMALEQGVSRPLRDYAQRVMDDHDVNTARLQAFLDAQRLLPPRELDAKDAAKLTILSKYTDRNFDTAYKKFTISSHNQMVTLLRGEIKNGKNADLKSYAESTLAMVQSHLKLARNVNLNSRATSSRASTAGSGR